LPLSEFFFSALRVYLLFGGFFNLQLTISSCHVSF
jgi:hypothetical protein